MRRQRAPYANRSVWYAVGILALVVVVGFAGAGYEINHLRTEVNSLNGQSQRPQSDDHQLSGLYAEAFRTGRK